MSKSLIGGGILAAVIVAWLALSTPQRPPTPWPSNYDDSIYYKMAEGYTGTPPFMWRLLYPTIVRLLPLPSLQTSFAAVAYISLWLCGVMFFVLLKHNNFSDLWSGAGVVLMYSLPDFAPYLAYNIYLVDSLAVFFILLVMYAASTRRRLLFFSALLFGVLVKESVLFSSVFWVTLGQERLRKRLQDACLMTAPAVAILLFLRLALQPDEGYSYLRILLIVARYRELYPAPISQYIPFGLLPVIALFSPRLRDLMRQYGVFVLLVYSQLIFATDTGRLVVIAFAPVIVGALGGAQLLGRVLTMARVNPRLIPRS